MSCTKSIFEKKIVIVHKYDVITAQKTLKKIENFFFFFLKLLAHF